MHTHGTSKPAYFHGKHFAWGLPCVSQVPASPPPIPLDECRTPARFVHATPCWRPAYEKAIVLILEKRDDPCTATRNLCRLSRDPGNLCRLSRDPGRGSRRCKECHPYSVLAAEKTFSSQDCELCLSVGRHESRKGMTWVNANGKDKKTRNR